MKIIKTHQFLSNFINRYDPLNLSETRFFSSIGLAKPISWWIWSLKFDHRNDSTPSILIFRFIHSNVAKLTRFVSIRVLRTTKNLFFVIEFAELLFFLIHRISIISRFLYDWRRLMTSIISRFSWMVPSLTKHSVMQKWGAEKLVKRVYWLKLSNYEHQEEKLFDQKGS